MAHEFFHRGEVVDLRECLIRMASFPTLASLWSRFYRLGTYPSSGFVRAMGGCHSRPTGWAQFNEGDVLVCDPMRQCSSQCNVPLPWWSRPISRAHRSSLGSFIRVLCSASLGMSVIHPHTSWSGRGSRWPSRLRLCTTLRRCRASRRSRCHSRLGCSCSTCNRGAKGRTTRDGRGMQAAHVLVAHTLAR